ncbi:histidine phosphatase family protein [Nitrospira sp. CMX1]|nr:histidine phosphatase family protein [Nitrospira sp.]
MSAQTTLRPTTVHLVHHGESLLNREKRVSGQLGTSLSSNGVRQARLLADQLRDVSLTGIYTSGHDTNHSLKTWHL